MTTTTLFAQPYSCDASGFYFTSPEAYEDQAAENTDRFGQPVEEYEVQHIEGQGADLFQALKITQGNVRDFFDIVETYTPDEQAALYFLVGERGMTLEEARDQLDDVCLTQQGPKEYGEALFDEIHGDLPQSVRMYVDTDGFTRDLLLGGDIDCFEYEGGEWTVTNANQF